MPWPTTARTVLLWLAIWFAPVALAALALGPGHVLAGTLARIVPRLRPSLGGTRARAIRRHDETTPSPRDGCRQRKGGVCAQMGQPLRPARTLPGHG